jgi:hypothetical protein
MRSVSPEVRANLMRSGEVHGSDEHLEAYSAGRSRAAAFQQERPNQGVRSTAERLFSDAEVQAAVLEYALFCKEMDVPVTPEALDAFKQGFIDQFLQKSEFSN